MHPHDGRVVSNFIVQALKNEPITIYGDGTQSRSFCYVDDLMTAFLALMATPAEFTGPVNLGNPTEFRISELAELIVALTGTKSKIQYRSLPSDDPLRRKPDITLARNTIDWEPKVQLEEGLARTIEYFESVLGPHIPAA